MKKLLRQQWYDKILFLMKITVLQVFLSFLFGSLAYATELKGQEILDKKVTLHVDNVELKMVLSEIEKIADIKFAYSSRVVRVKQKISVDADGKKLSQLLTELLNPFDVSYQVIAGRISLFRTPAHQLISEESNSEEVHMVIAYTVSGRVVDDIGQSLPGVNVVEKGTTNGTATDANGEFKINVSSGSATLLFSFIGYANQEVLVNNQSVINISLAPDVVTLQEIVVVGYGTQEKKVVTGAVSSVTSKDISNMAVAGLDQAIQGKMAGVLVSQNSGEPGGNVSVKIRGIGSFTAGTEPLYIVDGVPMTLVTGGLNSINPNDIERIDVLKDAASASIYGSRASNGVVLITTKQGKPGKVSVNFDMYAGVQSAAKQIDLLNSAEFATLANENLVNGGQAPNPAWSNPNSLPNYDWQDAVFRKASIQSYNVSAQGGGENSRVYFSLGHLNQEGILISSHYKRYNARLNAEFDVTKKLKLGGTFNFSHDDKSNPLTNSGDKGILTNATRLMPMNPINTDQEGSINSDFYGYQGYAMIANTANTAYFPSGLNNQVFVDGGGHYKRLLKSSNIQLSGFGEYEIIKGLKFRTAVNYARFNSLFWFSRLGQPQEISGFGPIIETSQYAETWRQFDQTNWINTLTYTKQFDKHNVMFVAGTDALQNISTQIKVDGSGNPNGQFNLNALTSKTATGFTEDYSLVSYFGRLTYDYASKYLLNVSFRRDGSSRFGPNNKYGNFPSASVGWRLSEESFLNNSKQINELKLRASYGIVGNQNIGNFKYANTYANDAGFYKYVMGTNQNVVGATYRDNIGDPSIRWEKSTQLDIGLDASLFNNTITLSTDYYIKRIEDMLGSAPIPTYLGVTGNTILRNEFSIENRGFELLLGFNKKIRAVNFTSSINFSTLENEVTELLGKSTDFLSRDIGSLAGDNGGSQTRSQIGERIGNFWGYVDDGIIQNATEAAASGMTGVKPGDRKFKDLNGDGKIDSEDRTVIGNGLPKYIYGLNLSATYKNFDFGVFFQGQGGVQIANMLKGYSMHISNDQGFINGSSEWLNRWTGEGSTNEFPRNSFNAPATNTYFSSYYIENGAFLRIRSMQLGYTIPNSLLNKVGLSSVRIYVSGLNIYTFTKYSGWDPEIGSLMTNSGGDATATSDFSDPLLTGVDFGRYPSPRVFTAGINIKL